MVSESVRRLASLPRPKSHAKWSLCPAKDIAVPKVVGYSYAFSLHGLGQASFLSRTKRESRSRGGNPYRKATIGKHYKPVNILPPVEAVILQQSGTFTKTKVEKIYGPSETILGIRTTERGKSRKLSGT